jgi:hypothetical protein
MPRPGRTSWTKSAQVIETDNFDVTFTGPWAAPQTVSVRAQRVGTVVTLRIGAVLLVAGTVASAASAAPGAIPVDFQPASTTEQCFAAIDGVMSESNGSISILSNGGISIAGVRTTGEFGIGAQAGWRSNSVTYMM